MTRHFLILLLWLPVAALAQVGSDHPVITEVMANPTGLLETEWVELYNPTDYSIDLRLFQLGDAIGLKNISDTSLSLGAHGYFVLTQDAARFQLYYPDTTINFAQPTGWQILNNTGGETVRLANSLGTVMDSMYYDKTFPDNRSWERFIDESGNSVWGGSFDPTGSTPGRANSFFAPRAASIEISVTPDPFSPLNGGYTTITVNPPDGETFDLAIYDISGNKVKEFFKDKVAIPGTFPWDGRDDNGGQLPPGIYIIYARVSGDIASDAKKTVVLAR